MCVGVGRGKLIQPGGEFSLGKKDSCASMSVATLAVQEVAGATPFLSSNTQRTEVGPPWLRLGEEIGKEGRRDFIHF